MPPTRPARAPGPSAIDSLPGSLTPRFRRDWAAAGALPGRVGLAVSGGPDSLALLLLAHDAMRGMFEVATVDHALRAGSAAEAAEVARICAVREIPHATLTVTVDASGNLQQNARDARYAALAGWIEKRRLAAIVTAHHADDQAETLLMRLGRGAGVRGLAGMRAASPLPGAPGRLLLRPLLAWRRSELAEVVAAAGLVAAQDPSNTDPRFARIRARRMLADAPGLDPAALAISAAHLADADAVLCWAADREWAEAVCEDGPALTYRPAAPRAVRLRVLERIAARIGSSVPRGAELARWLETLEAGGTATLAGVKADARGDARGDPRGNLWCFTAAPPRRS